jgi:hypothetical protein
MGHFAYLFFLVAVLRLLIAPKEEMQRPTLHFGDWMKTPKFNYRHSLGIIPARTIITTACSSHASFAVLTIHPFSRALLLP